MTLENKHAREPFNFYPEGPSASDALFRSGKIDKGELIYDPACGCGCGSILRMAHANGYRAAGDDIRMNHDFLEVSGLSPDSITVATNPPYGGRRGDRTEVKFIEHAIKLGAAEVWALLPLPWMAVRVGWLRDHGCAGIYVLQPRLSILSYSAMKAGEWPGGGGKDYAWYRFIPGTVGQMRLGELERNPELDTKENWTWWDE